MPRKAKPVTEANLPGAGATPPAVEIVDLDTAEPKELREALTTQIARVQALEERERELQEQAQESDAAAESLEAALTAAEGEIAKLKARVVELEDAAQATKGLNKLTMRTRLPSGVPLALLDPTRVDQHWIRNDSGEGGWHVDIKGPRAGFLAARTGLKCAELPDGTWRVYAADLNTVSSVSHSAEQYIQLNVDKNEAPTTVKKASQRGSSSQIADMVREAGVGAGKTSGGIDILALIIEPTGGEVRAVCDEQGPYAVEITLR